MSHFLSKIAKSITKKQASARYSYLAKTSAIRLLASLMVSKGVAAFKRANVFPSLPKCAPSFKTTLASFCNFFPSSGCLIS